MHPRLLDEHGRITRAALRSVAMYMEGSNGIVDAVFEVFRELDALAVGFLLCLVVFVVLAVHVVLE